MRRVLLISHDPVGTSMAGLGIRTFELGRVLRDHAEVTIAHGGTTRGELEGMLAVPFGPHDYAVLREHVARADTIVCHPVWPVLGGWLRRSNARIVHDLYDPETLETLELFAGQGALQRRMFGQLTVDRLHDALRTGHHFMCASEKQRDLWIGAMLALRMIDPLLHDADPALRHRLDTVPFGVPDDPPPLRPSAPGPREVFAQIADGDEIVLWNGGIWRWLDSATAVRAVCALAQRRPGVRLVFMGGSAGGSADQASAQATERARAVAAGLGALDDTVLFHGGWVPYAERAAWLTQASCALSTHPDHLETRFAFRTRILDCFWARLPVVCTAGDDLADRVARDDLGLTAPPGDHLAVAAALERVLDQGRGAYAGGLRRAAEDFTWARVARPLVEWVTAGTAPPHRPGDAPGAVRPTAGHRARALAYRSAGRRLMARRGAGRG